MLPGISATPQVAKGAPSGGGGGGSIALGAQATLLATSTNTDQYESNEITGLGGGSNLVVALISLFKETGSDANTRDSLTYGTAGRAFGNGTAMNVALAPEHSSARSHLVIAWLAGVSANGTVQIDMLNAQRACVIDVFELTGVDQTTPIPTTNSKEGPDTVTTDTIGLTTANDNSWLIGQANVGGGADALTNDDGTQLHAAETGTTGFNDTNSAAAYKVVSPAGVETISFSWTGSDEYVMAAIEVKPA